MDKKSTGAHPTPENTVGISQEKVIYNRGRIPQTIYIVLLVYLTERPEHYFYRIVKRFYSMTFENKSVVVTGAGSGIGRETALQFAAAGASVLVADIDSESVTATRDAITEAGGTAYAVTADVSDNAAVEAMIQTALVEFGSIDIAINNAGISGAHGLGIHEYSEDSFDSVMAINVKGVWLCLKHEVPALLQNGGGSIVNVASVAGLIGVPGNAAYAASKHAVVGMTKSVALETAKLGVRVNAVCPSFIDTPMVGNITQTDPNLEKRITRASPMRRLGTVEEVAEAIVWLSSPAASFVNGTTLAIDGGLVSM